MPSLWIQHVKSYARQYNIPYKEALKLAKPSYSKFGTVSTEPSQIKLKLNDEQYNLNTVAIKPTFKKGSTETHIVNIKYNSDEAIKIPPNPLEPNIVENIEVIPPNPLVPNIEELQEYIPQTIQHKNINIKRSTPIYSELAEPIYSPFGVSDKPNRKKKLNTEYQTLDKPAEYKNIKALKSQFETAQNKKHYDSNIKALKSQIETQKQQREMNEMGFNDINIKPTKKKFIINELKHIKDINKINAKMNKIKNMDMSKYLNKPITPNPIPKKNEHFDFLNEPPKPKFERLEKNHPYYDILTPQGIIPFEFIEHPEFNNDQDKKIKFLNKLLAQHINLLNIFKNSKMEEDEKKTLINECMMNIQIIQKYIFDVEELKKLEDIEINKIEQKNKEPINKEPSVKELLKSKDPFSLLKNEFTTLSDRKNYYSDLYRKLNKEMEKWGNINEQPLENNPYYILKTKIYNFQQQTMEKLARQE